MVPAAQKQTITSFADGEAQWLASATPASDPMRTLTSQTDDSLSEFFSRPIQIATYTWTPATTFALTRLTPWLSYFTNPRVANRLSNYHLINCTLKVKFQVSGNGFYWGRLMADWHPYFSTDVVTSSADTFGAAVGASQRIKVFLDPTNSQGAELHIPFVYHRNSMNVVDAEWALLGSVILRELVQLQHANASVSPVTINVFAWAEDVVASIPTTVNAYGLTAQADETEGPVTKLSSAAAAAAGALSVVPSIAPLAMATQMVSSGIGQVARLYGFSRPPSLKEPTPMRPRYISPTAVTDMGDEIDKLTVTSRQQVTIDPRVVGVDTGDELCIADIAKRESYVANYSWSTSTASGTMIRNIRVNPYETLTDSTYYYMPACAFAVRPFKYWTGKMRYRIVVVASAFHKGRLRIVWDPQYIAGTGLPEMNMGFSQVVDLEGEREFIIDIPWGQADPFLSNVYSIGSTINQTSSTRYTTSASNVSNGVLGIFVQNALTSVSALPSTVSILVFKSAQELCVAQPNEGFDEIVNAYSYTPQSEEVETVPDSTAPVAVLPATQLGDGSCDDTQMSIFFGEHIVSFRQLLKRYQLHSVYRDLTSSALASWNIQATDFPAYKGYSSSALHATTTAKKINYVQNTLLHYLAPAFLACRGGMRAKYHFTSTGGEACLNGMSIERQYNRGYVGQTLALLTTTSPSTFARENLVARSSMFNGASVTVPEKQPVLEVELPYYKGSRFDLTKDIDLSYDSGTRAGFGLGANVHNITCIVSGSGTRQLTRYVAVAEDFNLVFFQGAPPMAAFPTATLPAAALT